MKNMKDLGMISTGHSTIIYFKKYFGDQREYEKQEIINALLDTSSELMRYGEMHISDIQLHGQYENKDLDQIYLDINKPIQEVVESFCKISAMKDTETYSISFSL